MIVYKFYSANIAILFGKRKRRLRFFNFLYCVSQKLRFIVLKTTTHVRTSAYWRRYETSTAPEQGFVKDRMRPFYIVQHVWNDCAARGEQQCGTWETIVRHVGNNCAARVVNAQ